MGVAVALMEIIALNEMKVGVVGAVVAAAQTAITTLSWMKVS